MSKRKAATGKIAYAMVAFFDDREELITSLIRPRRRDLIEHAQRTFYSGAHDWAYIKRQGWRIQKIKITSVKP